MSFIQSALTPPGTNARRAQDDRNREISGMSADLLRQYMPTLQKQLGLRAEMMPIVEQMIMQQIASMSQQNLHSNADRIRQQGTAAGQKAGRSMGSLFGEGSALAKGAAVDASNRAQTAGNDFLARGYDPQYQAQLSAQIMQMINGATQPDLNVLGSLGGMVYGQPQVHVGQGIGGILGGIAGQVLGGKASAGKL